MQSLSQTQIEVYFYFAKSPKGIFAKYIGQYRLSVCL